MKKYLASGFVSRAVNTFVIFSLLISCVSFSAQCAEISDKVLRLHILANSDSQYDQEIKLELRDALLEQSEKLLGCPLSKADAAQYAGENISEIENFLNSELKALGADYTASCEITHMYFNTRKYDDSTMPAGFYDALRIKLGRAEGQNWWCVLFPPICLSGAVEEKEVFTDEEEQLLDSGEEYEIGFKVVEFYDYIRSVFCSEE